MATKNQTLRQALQRSVQALDDWLHTYAPEFCTAESVEETRKRIAQSGGTLAYLADVQQQNREALSGLKG